MGRGLSELQKWIICKLGIGKTLTQDYVLTNFYAFEKRSYCWDGRKIGFSEWYKEGKEIEIFDYSPEAARSAFCHSVQSLRRRGLVKGSVREYDLTLTELGREQFNNLSINVMLTLIDKPTEIRIEQHQGGSPP